MHKKTIGIIIKRKKVGEADKLLTIFTSNLGKINALAKGIERISSKRAGHLEPLMLSQIELVHNKNYNFIISEVKSLNNFKNLRKNLGKTLVACYLIELVDKAIGFGEKNIQIFKLIKESLNLLDKAENKDILSIVYSFKIHLINLLGFKPEFEYCVVCRKKILSDSLYFDPLEGGILCKMCNSNKSKTVIISKNIIESIKFLQRNSLQEAPRLNREEFQEISKIIDFYIEFILEQELQSKKIIKEINENRLKNGIQKNNQKTKIMAEKVS